MADKGFHKFEIVQMINLNPESVEEAKALIPRCDLTAILSTPDLMFYLFHLKSICRLDDVVLDEIVTELQSGKISI